MTKKNIDVSLKWKGTEDKIEMATLTVTRGNDMLFKAELTGGYRQIEQASKVLMRMVAQ